MLTPGTRLGSYKITSLLGSGGMGEIYRAKDLKLARDVAIKVLREELAADPERLRRFEQEARSASALNHPNIITIHDIGKHEGTPYIAMEFVKGQTLRELLRGGPLPLSKTIVLATQLAEGLEKAHAAAIVHRDLKPENLMVSEDGFVKILDFGLAKLVPKAEALSESVTTAEMPTRPGVIMGTLGYMSPEQARGGSVDYRSDQFSLGSILYEMTTGKRAFKRETGVQTLSAVIECEPQPVDELNPSVPPGFVAVIERCLKKSPRERYDGTRELARELQALRDQSIQLGAKKGVIHLVRPMTRRARNVLIGVTSLIALAFVSFSLTGASFREMIANLLQVEEAIAFAERDWLLIADFENQTGEAIFDKSLDTAFTIGITQSRYVNVLPRRRIENTLRRMKRDDVEHIDEALAREIAEREGVKVVLVPGISGVGGVYALTAMLQDPASGVSLRSEMVQARGKEHLLEALGELADRVRLHLGEAQSAVAERSRPLSQVTTASFEALKQFSLGRAAHRARNYERAIQSYENALQRDPDFAMAEGWLGVLHFERFDHERGSELIRQALENLENLTERERTYLLAFYADIVEGNLGKAAGLLETFLAEYPDDSSLHNSLGFTYARLGRYEGAVVQYQQAIRVDPHYMVPYDGLNYLYLYELGDVRSALEWGRKQIDVNDDHPYAHGKLGWAALAVDDLELAEVSFTTAVELMPESAVWRFRLGHTYRLKGEYQRAVQTFEQILESGEDARVAPLSESVASAHYDAGTVYQLMGNDQSARKHLTRYRDEVKRSIHDDPENGANYMELALVLARLGDDERVEQISRKALKLDPRQHFDYARLLSVQGRTEEALNRLEQAVAEGFSNYIWMKIHADLQNIYDQTRFQSLLDSALER